MSNNTRITKLGLGQKFCTQNEVSPFNDRHVLVKNNNFWIIINKNNFITLVNV